ncbi:MAG: hypothetical protein LBF01_02780 [Bacteroidales bacterium]|jgi:hypothetical protein|nr:hypothetical protein [Bacteroidales bacterium]
MKVSIRYIRYYAIALLLLSLIGTEIYYVPVYDFKLSAYRFFLAFLPVVYCFIPYKEFITNLKYGMGWFAAYLLLAWLPHAFFSVYWSSDFSFIDNLIFFIGATLTALLLTGTSSGKSTAGESEITTKIYSKRAEKKNFLKVFYVVEIGICTLGFICCMQYLFNYVYQPVLSINLLDQNLPEITLFGQESSSGYSAMKWWNENANVFIFSSFVITFIGYLSDKRKSHLIFFIFFLLVSFLAR